MEKESMEEISRRIQDNYRAALELNKKKLMYGVANALDESKIKSEYYQQAVLETLRSIDALSVYDKRIPVMLFGKYPVFKIEEGRIGVFNTLDGVRTNIPSLEKITTTPVYLRDGKFYEAKEESGIGYVRDGKFRDDRFDLGYKTQQPAQPAAYASFGSREYERVSDRLNLSEIGKIGLSGTVSCTDKKIGLQKILRPNNNI